MNITSGITIVSVLVSAFSPFGGAPDGVAFAVLALGRFGVGFGVGGVYPLSAAK